MQTLGLTPEQAVPFLKKHLSPIAAIDAKRTAQLIKDLDSDEFAIREKATEDLDKLGAAAQPILRQALKGDLSEEARARLQKVVDHLGAVSSMRWGELRAIEVLERIGTPEARDVLQILAKGAAGGLLTQEAQASLQRLAEISPAKP
jgi:hypothetical protein